MGEEEVILEHETDGPLLGRDVASGRRLLERLAVELDTTRLNRDKSRNRAQQGRLAGPVGAQQRDHLALLDLDLHLQAQRPERGAHLHVEAHAEPSQRCLNPTRTASETRSRSRLRRNEPSGLVSRRR